MKNSKIYFNDTIQSFYEYGLFDKYDNADDAVVIQLSKKDEEEKLASPTICKAGHWKENWVGFFEVRFYMVSYLL